MLRLVIGAVCVSVAAAFSPAAIAPTSQGIGARSAFVTGLRSGHGLRSVSTRRTAIAPQMVSFPFGKKSDDEKPRFGGENPYRTFGVTEDAPYEEVEAAYKELVEENKDDEKYCIKLEMMKEAIFDDRLKARMSGALKSKIQDSPFEAKLQEKKEPWWSKIAWLKNLVKMPTKKYTIQLSALMSAFIIAGILAPQLASTTMGFGFLSAMGFLYNRGTPDIRRDDMGNPGESRPANYGALGKTVGLCMIGGGLGFAFAQVLVTNVYIPAFLAGDAVVNTFFNLGLYVTALFLQVQDES